MSLLVVAIVDVLEAIEVIEVGTEVVPKVVGMCECDL
jgi:hypothetical protein